MRLREFTENDIDVWPAFTDFLTSVLFIVVLFVFGVFFANIFRSLLAEDNAYRNMKARQARVQSELKKIRGVEVPTADGNLQRIILQVDEQGSGGVLFDRGQALLKNEGKQLLSRIVNVLEKNKDAYDTIQVEGHTDDTPIGTMQYPSNWELSAARAGAVVNHLISRRGELEPWRFSANGRAEYRPYEVVDNKMNLDRRPNPRYGPNLGYVVSANQTELQARRNRRIEVILTYKVTASRRQ